MEKSGIYDVITMRSNRFPVLDPFSNICPPLEEVVLPMETLSLASSFPEELDSFRNITYVSEVEESKWDVEDDWERKHKGDSENNFDNGGSNDDNEFDPFEDMQWNILLLSFKYLSTSYFNTYSTIFNHVKSSIPKKLLVDSYCFFNRSLLTSKNLLTVAEKVCVTIILHGHYND